ncbi:MAG: exo-alpha-sialidase [Tannerella sp.]|jgi:hypothetical protein|nr:exo-alpha-sialidase [Tannerella sp.]
MKNTIVYLLLISGFFSLQAQTNKDWRNIENAVAEIPSEGYCDQPYVIINKQNEWVCTLTTGKGTEGEPGQHVVATISKDRGKNWSQLIDIEPASGPEASWVVPFIVPSGRIYAFYTYNFENLREIKDINGKSIKRVDTFGKMMMKYSDDGGYTWSSKRYEVPIRNFEIDDNNIYGGKIQFFWSVAIPIVHRNALYFPLSKVGNFGEGFMENGAGAILKSSNILTESNPEKIKWETLPDGNKGLLPPVGKVADEHNIVSLNDGSLYCVYRTNQGYNVQTYSRDNGHTWTTPEWGTYIPGEQKIKQPRCFNKLYKFKNGKYALFFHNNSTRYYSQQPIENRNPTWISGGIEKEGYIYWSQPEIFLYDTNFEHGISYPDWIEDNGEYFFTETQKEIARIHKIPNEYMDMLWYQAENNSFTNDGIVLQLNPSDIQLGKPFNIPNIGRIYRGNSFSLELVLKTGTLDTDQLILDTRIKETTGVNNNAKYAGNGIVLTLKKEGAIEILMDDGRSPLLWRSDLGSIKPNSNHHVVVTIDANVKILTFVVDGILCDGGERPWGFARFNPYTFDINGENEVAFSNEFKGMIYTLRVYNRALYTSEAIANYHSINFVNIHKEWLRTNPDVVVYLPDGEENGDNEHFLVFEAPKSDELLAIWTQSSVEGHGDNRAVIARSKDGKNWSPPQTIAGKSIDRLEGQASWAFPVVSLQGRIYCFFTKETQNPDTRQHSGVMGCLYSDDNGYTWIQSKDIDVPKNKYDNADITYTPNWIVWQKPIQDGKGRYISGYTQWSSETVIKSPTRNWTDQDSRSYFMRFENLDENPLPEEIVISWLPVEKVGIEVPHKTYPHLSVAQEPSVVLLPDKRLFAVMRTMTGYIWYSVSDDNGDTWRKPEVLRYKDGGEMIRNPMASCPIYSLSKNRFILIHYDNDGKRGAYDQFKEVWNNGNQLNFLRNPACISLGKFVHGAYQPIWFSRSKEFLTTNDFPVGPKGTAEVATYPSITEKNGVCTLWYPDRKHFLLGKYLTESLFEELEIQF